MNCQQIREYLDTTLPEEFSADVMGDIRRHARDCTGCAAYLRGTLDLDRRLTELPAVPAGEAVLPAVMARVRQDLPAPAVAPVPLRERAGETLRWVALAAAVVICMLAYYGRVASGEWLQQLMTLQVRSAALAGGGQHPSAVFAGLCGAGALLAAAATLWKGEREPNAAPMA